MKKYHYLAVLGVLLIAVGIMMWTPVIAQDDEGGTSVPPPAEFLTEFYEAWVGSPHADVEAEAFNHWNEDEEQVVPERCAACHSTAGYLDYVGADGSEAGVVDAPAPLGTVVSCDVCHNSVTSTLTAVTFPSGVEITDLNDASRCMVCHQGRQSGLSVANAVEEAGVGLNDVSEDLGFINIHYYAAAASLYGGEVHAGFEFDGKTYQLRGDHVEGYDTCIDCHEPHTLELQIEECAICHEDVEDVDDVREIRMAGSLSDYDGDGDIEEGIADEIAGLQEMLWTAITTYSTEVAGTPIVYGGGYPYYFADMDGDGEGDERYGSFTPLLLQAVYNYQVSLKDPGGYAHNPKYHVEILYDSIEALNEAIMEPVDLSTATRDDPGHFDSTAEAFRHWDEDGEVSGRCAKCHTAEGLPFFIEEGVNVSMDPSLSLSCATCHDSLSEFTLTLVNEVEMPSGAVVSFGEEDENNTCLNCHQGRESGVSVNASIARAGVGDDEVTDALRFQNIHYFAAGATLFGSEAVGGYQFDGKEYSGRFEHVRSADTCSDCHNVHQLTIQVEECADCHEEVDEDNPDVTIIRMTDEDEVELIDYDGDGDMEEPIADEIATLHADLLVRIQTYTNEVIGEQAMYVPYAYPYWYVDANANGEIDEGEVNGDARYGQWTPALLRAAYNYQYVAKDPGSFAHNADYTLQLLYDSIESLGGEDAVASYTRAPVVMDD